MDEKTMGTPSGSTPRQTWVGIAFAVLIGLAIASRYLPTSSGPTRPLNEAPISARTSTLGEREAAERKRKEELKRSDIEGARRQVTLIEAQIKAIEKTGAEVPASLLADLQKWQQLANPK